MKLNKILNIVFVLAVVNAWPISVLKEKLLEEGSFLPRYGTIPTGTRFLNLLKPNFCKFKLLTRGTRSFGILFINQIT